MIISVFLTKADLRIRLENFRKKKEAEAIARAKTLAQHDALERSTKQNISTFDEARLRERVRNEMSQKQPDSNQSVF